MKPGKVPGPIRIRPNKKSDLVDYRKAKRLQDHLNWMVTTEPDNPWRWLLGLDKPGKP